MIKRAWRCWFYETVQQRVSSLLLFLQRTTSRICRCPAVSTRSPVLCGDLWENLSSPATRMERSTSSVPRLVKSWGFFLLVKHPADTVWANCCRLCLVDSPEIFWRRWRSTAGRSTTSRHQWIWPCSSPLPKTTRPRLDPPPPGPCLTAYDWIQTPCLPTAWFF